MDINELYSDLKVKHDEIKHCLVHQNKVLDAIRKENKHLKFLLSGGKPRGKSRKPKE